MKAVTIQKPAAIVARASMAVLACVSLALMRLLASAPAQVAQAQSQQPNGPDGPIETLVAFLTLAAPSPTPTRTSKPTATPPAMVTHTPTTRPTATATSTHTPTPKLTATALSTATFTPVATSNPTATKPVPPSSTPIATTPTPEFTRTPTPTLTPQYTPTEEPVATRPTQQPNSSRTYLPLALKDYPCELALPDCFEDNNGFAKAYGSLRIGQTYTATEEIVLDRYDYYTVTLTSGTRYTVTLNFPRFDVDLYLQGNAPAYAILARSATTQNGGSEQFIFTPTITADYYVLVYTYAATGLVNYQLQVTSDTGDPP